MSSICWSPAGKCRSGRTSISSAGSSVRRLIIVSCTESAAKGKGPGKGQRSRAPDQLRERLALDELHRQVDEPFGRLTEVVDGADVSVRDAAGIRRLAIEAGHRFGIVHHGRVHHLDGAAAPHLHVLGAGGMGQEHPAEHVKRGRRSALNGINPSMAHAPEAVARFNREAANASRISDAHVCAIYDFGETPEGLIYLAMEFIEGEPLTELIRSEGALPLARAADIAIQVAAALQAAHDLGIVHRDLKPDNIMLTRGRDGVDLVKVVDFGIAKAVGGDDSQKVTKTGLVVGTPEFMSPEQLSGDKLDGRSDLYSLALVLFKMLTGKLPFQATSVQETMIKRLTDDPATLVTARPDLRFPPGLQETLDAALARGPTERYQSAAKFANDVAGVVGLERRGGLVT